MEVVPVNFGLKYKPPKLGVQYHIKDQPNTFFVHEIPLSFVQKGANIDVVTKEIVDKNKVYLNPKIVSAQQVRRLVERLIKVLTLQDDKENNQISTNKGQKQTTGLSLGPSKGFNQQNKFEISPTQSERSDRFQGATANNVNANQSISRIESIKEGEDSNQKMEGQGVDLLISDIQQNQSLRLEGGEHEDLEQLLKTGAFTKEMMMGQTLRDLGSTIKEANAAIDGQKKQIGDDEDYGDAFESQEQHFEGEPSQIHQEVSQQFMDDLEEDELNNQQLANDQPQEDEDIIDIDNPDELAAKGLKRIQIEGEDEEYLMDMEGNIYDLRGNFIGTTDGDQNVGGDSQVMGEGEEQFAEGDDY